MLPKTDTVRLANAIVIVEYIPNTTIISSTYNDIMNSNNIVLFEDFVLKNLLDNYYIKNEWERLFNDRILNKDKRLKFYEAGHGLPPEYINDVINWITTHNKK